MIENAQAAPAADASAEISVIGGDRRPNALTRGAGISTGTVAFA
ncbi:MULTISPECIES: hypothetical protein [Cryobacterium]|nr:MULTISPECIES: hypothetical protein [Cryobacterium]MDY7529273.1 hypothetical protein [Cryobacterium sp. 10C2]MDY7558568.1 hypothetical protein [Cryobacterium sp. 10C3]MEB0002817.1 hypothetical protein [Cryobacterium sp. RTC2.1]MEB0203560.1 hypothetical protein [Cryobacterium sp. 5I3]MEB0287703.1 hypothetical protein [Cryobacterium sp. 10S3]